MNKFSLRTSVTSLRNGKIIKNVLIVLSNQDETYVVHPLSNILLENRSWAYNTQRNIGNSIVQFLNWLQVNRFTFKEQEVRLSRLELYKIEHYLDTLQQEGKSLSTINSAIKALTKLIDFLIKHNILEEDIVKEVNERRISSSKLFQTSINSRRRVSHNLIHEIDRHYIPYFLDLAFKEVKPIALGLCIQIFGGLRTGECVNLTRDSISIKGAYGSEGLSIDVEKRFLRPDLKDIDGSSEVKKERTQMVFPNKFLPIFLEAHLNNYKDLTGKNALFIDSKGNPMTGTTYRYYFEKLKTLFIKNLLNSNNLEHVKYGLFLNSHKWSSHICRGTFSNWIAESSSNPMDLALARGDSDISSSLVYMEHSESFINGVHTVVNKMFEEAEIIGGD